MIHNRRSMFAFLFCLSFFVIPNFRFFSLSHMLPMFGVKKKMPNRKACLVNIDCVLKMNIMQLFFSLHLTEYNLNFKIRILKKIRDMIIPRFYLSDILQKCVFSSDIWCYSLIYKN